MIPVLEIRSWTPFHQQTPAGVGAGLVQGWCEEHKDWPIPWFLIRTFQVEGVSEDGYFGTDEALALLSSHKAKCVRWQSRPLQKMVISRNSPMAHFRTKLIPYPKKGQCKEPEHHAKVANVSTAPCHQGQFPMSSLGAVPGAALIFDSEVCDVKFYNFLNVLIFKNYIHLYNS